MCLWVLIINNIEKEALPRTLTAPLYQPDVLMQILSYFKEVKNLRRLIEQQEFVELGSL